MAASRRPLTPRRRAPGAKAGEAADAPPAAGPLHGVRVVELGSVVLAPWACQTLGDLGADVVKVEPPTGDSNRYVGPARHPGMGALFLGCNRNKRSLVLDLEQAAARAALVRLLAGADVLVHNHRPAALRRLRIDPTALRARYPRLLVCGTYGFGRRGPYRDRPAYDDSIQAAAGLAMLAARAGGAPAYVPTIVADKATALTVVLAVLAALVHRERSGVGQEIEVPMFETLAAFLMPEHLYGMSFDPPRGPAGYARVLSPHRRPYRTRDGWLAVLPYLDRHWRAFCRVARRPDLARDPRFASLAARTAHIDETYAEVARVLATRTSADWTARLERAGVPVTAVNRLEDLFDDVHLRAVGFWRTLDHPTEGRLRTPAPPMEFSATPASLRRPPPRLGEHSVEVLREAGLPRHEIDALLASGATLAAAPVRRGQRRGQA